MDDYRAVLAKVDAWYRDVRSRHPDKVPCTKGCRDCCLGLFDVSLADRDLLREGLAAADPAVRADIEARASAVLERLRAIYPDLGETLDGWSPDDIDDLCDALGDVECPVLGPEGECRLYAHRPMTCRMAGVPVVDVTGLPIQPEGCARCTLRPQETPRLDCEALRREERRVLRRRYPGSSGTSLLIPQAVGPRERTA
ncbi:MAG TPA: YkgJ family cysteine cluster protein [Planctomycetota bacterium]|nr:YkgJ family cysteine cluster protein [Planctomycetota bacterium]